ncbi:MAG: hypothetical protein LBI59_11920, partial [Candidatus Accumulibacter sp.]|nr:hypothetical protein [Accumulibacter sp.]
QGETAPTGTAIQFGLSQPDTLTRRNREGDYPPPPKVKPAAENTSGTRPPSELPAPPDAPAWEAGPPQEHVVSPAAGTERLQAIQQLVAEHAGDASPDFALPIQADGLYPITDVWRIEPSLDTPEALRTHIAQFAREIAGEVGLAECIVPTEHGIGFDCTLPSLDALADSGRAVLGWLSLLSGDFPPILSDAGLVKLFRLLRLSRRLRDIDATPDDSGR